MKSLFYYLKLLKKSKSNPNFRKRAILFGSLGIFTFLTIGSLALWGGLSALSYVSDATRQVLSTPAANEPTRYLEEQLKDLPNLQAVACLDKAQRLLAVSPWLERPVLANLIQLKDACLASGSSGEHEIGIESEETSKLFYDGTKI